MQATNVQNCTVIIIIEIPVGNASRGQHKHHRIFCSQRGGAEILNVLLQVIADVCTAINEVNVRIIKGEMTQQVLVLWLELAKFL